MAVNKSSAMSNGAVANSISDSDAANAAGLKMALSRLFPGHGRESKAFLEKAGNFGRQILQCAEVFLAQTSRPP